MKFLVKCWSGWMPEEAWLERVIGFLIVIAPVFYLSVPHWITNVSILAVLLILLSSAIHRNYFSVYKHRNILTVLGMYLLYFVAIAVSQMGRGVFVAKEYLDQTRWLLGIPLFAFLLYFRINFAMALRWLAPFIVLSAGVSGVFIIPSDAWGERATIAFMDPLAFGFMNLSVGMMCLVTVALNWRQERSRVLVVLNAVGFLAGIYLSLRSGSRTGWFAFPFVLLLIAGFFLRNSSEKKIYALLVLLLPMGLVFLLLNSGNIRLAAFVNEVSAYPWQGGVAADTSVELRITFYRLGAYYFSQSPWFGWGDRGYLAIKDAAEVLNFSSAYARDFAYNALFHSEWTTQAVRFGLLGLLAVFWVFAVPFYLFATRLRTYAQASLMGLAFLMCQLAASFSTEIYSSKGMITFSVIVVAGLLASVLGQDDRLDH